ncbi:hypothetical protein RW25_06015 [Bacillus sp. L_1B0_8]|uniref:hypothetical protein n=1 Tax=unclassified Bacillus (in: firmicutes) TaxID=185979 RepID=UPI0005B6C8B8|nr:MULTISPECIES: hypothetical protein [unclassified Bacillus (in: firmicutes)]KIQ91327.1 hypothetical protein RW25_06015 [Bacillus sp. L_1B0_8]KIQ91371.1 hypothetical protein RT27_02900 [Bacillus sp. L_1B0_5]
MVKYRLGYDYVFIPNEPIAYKGEDVSSMSVYVLFQVFDENGQERLFESEELEDQRLSLKNGESCYLTNLVRCSFDKETILSFERNQSVLKDSGYTIEWTIDSYSKDVGIGFAEAQEISKEEWMDMMVQYRELFDNRDNESAQSVAYFTEEVTV